MTCKPDVALVETASGSLAHRQILADLLQSIAKQRILLERASIVTTVLVSRLYGSRGNPFLNMRLSWLSQPKRLPTPALENACYMYEMFA